MRKVCSLTILIVFIALAAQGAFAASFDPATAALGARPMGLGMAYVGLADDTNALFLNPAGLPLLLKEWSATSMFTKLLDTVEYRMIGGTYSTEYGNFGVGYIGTSNPAGYHTGAGESDIYDPISFNTHTLVVSYGNRLDRVYKTDALPEETYVGANVKFTNQGFSGSGQDDKSGFGYNVDLAALARVVPWAQIGVKLNNLLPNSMTWASGSKDNMPAALNLGGAFSLLGPEGASLYKSDHAVLGLLEGKMGFAAEDGFTLHGGLEWQPVENLKVRFGMDQNNVSVGENSVGSVFNLTAGVGYTYAGITFDYAYHQDSHFEKNQSHYFSISYAPEMSPRRTEKKTSVPSVKRSESKGHYIDKDGYIIIIEDGPVHYDRPKQEMIIVQD